MTYKVVITGANRGIGLALTKHYLARGDEVVALCREASENLRATNACLIENVDVSDASNISALAGDPRLDEIDVLINNAGILHSDSLGDINYSDIRQQLEVNAIAPLNVTEALLGKLKSKSKVALITSRMGSINDNTSGGYYGYRMSKAALNAAGQSLARDLQSRGIAVAILHPGFVQTDMVNRAGDISADTASERLAQRIEELNINNTGTFWHANGEVLPW